MVWLGPTHKKEFYDRCATAYEYTYGQPSPMAGEDEKVKDLFSEFVDRVFLIAIDEHAKAFGKYNQ